MTSERRPGPDVRCAIKLRRYARIAWRARGVHRATLSCWMNNISTPPEPGRGVGAWGHSHGVPPDELQAVLVTAHLSHFAECHDHADEAHGPSKRSRRNPALEDELLGHAAAAKPTALGGDAEAARVVDSSTYLVV